MCFIVEFQNYADWTAGRQQPLSENVPLLDLTCVRAPAAPTHYTPVCPMLRCQLPPASLSSGLTA